ncbi:hypothetical protein CPter291_1157 [Collimonas pratensis]|uniref:Uncharacterized protein n=1 Tax=Collimonas pratensis TaxID=279113 RepID=A0ABN4M8H8_9BURK|nr:hypothetical protein CPter291_1157 [Collimonas pratensis]
MKLNKVPQSPELGLLKKRYEAFAQYWKVRLAMQQELHCLVF